MAPKKSNFRRSQLVELSSCTKCGECRNWCEAFTGDKATEPRQKVQDIGAMLKGERLPGLLSRLLGGRKLTSEELDQLSKAVYGCTMCSRCSAVCPVGIDLEAVWQSMRRELADMGKCPPALFQVKDAIVAQHNVYSYPNDERGGWTDFASDVPADLYQREKAEVVYFVGCLASFSPSVQSITETLTSLLTKAGVDFTIMGKHEWCCGFPLMTAGMNEAAEELKRHNIDRVRQTGAKSMVFSCPSCYRTWKHEYQQHLPEVEMLHSTQFILRLIKQGKLKLGPVNKKLTYHDPCDLGRNSGVFEEPRQIIKAIPSAVFVEPALTREHGFCCGGGGDLEISDSALAATISEKAFAPLKDTGADIIVTACQQCKRMLLKAREKAGGGPQVLDITELVMTSIKSV